jgi:hypothetical protein
MTVCRGDGPAPDDAAHASCCAAATHAPVCSATAARLLLPGGQNGGSWSMIVLTPAFLGTGASYERQAIVRGPPGRTIASATERSSALQGQVRFTNTTAGSQLRFIWPTSLSGNSPAPLRYSPAPPGQVAQASQYRALHFQPLGSANPQGSSGPNRS